MPTFTVSGMTCAHCISAVTQAVHEVDPAAPVEIDLASGRVEIDSAASRDELARAIEGAGYTVEKH
jgi:copper chaperone CopZ